jgi:CRISPR-associated protein Cmr4
MTSVIMGMLAETSLHPGTGQVSGTVDLPVAREKTTNYPVIVGSSLKGALKDTAEQYLTRNKIDLDLNQVFGTQNQAGAVAVTDGRLLLLPVRSLNSHYKWVTCPYLLERFQRDCELAGLTSVSFDLQPLRNLEDGKALAVGKGRLYIEDIQLEIEAGAKLESFAEEIKSLIKHDSVKERLADNLVIVNDKEFNFFATYSLAINARNQLDNNKISQNLWYEETIPPDSLFYTLLFARPGEEGALDSLVQMFKQHPYLQVGGNETVGQGWCAISCIDGGGENR